MAEKVELASWHAVREGKIVSQNSESSILSLSSPFLKGTKMTLVVEHAASSWDKFCKRWNKWNKVENFAPGIMNF